MTGTRCLYKTATNDQRHIDLMSTIGKNAFLETKKHQLATARDLAESPFSAQSAVMALN